LLRYEAELGRRRVQTCTRPNSENQNTDGCKLVPVKYMHILWFSSTFMFSGV
jgi:hypothetical protein